MKNPSPSLIETALAEVSYELVRRNGTPLSEVARAAARLAIEQFAAYGQRDVELLKLYALAVLSQYARYIEAK
jgi:hypothetical protein